MRNSNWNADWFPLPGQAVFDRNKQRVTAVSRAPGNLDLFVIGFDNRIWTTFWTQEGGWNGDWFPLPGQAVFDRDKQRVTAVSRAPGNLDLFVIGFDNRIWTTFWTQEGGWNADWFPLPGQAVFDRDKQRVTAVSRAPGNLDLFVIGFDNRIWTTFWTQEGGWNADWFPLPGQAVFDRDTQHVAAVSRTPSNLDLFVIGFDNHIWTTFWTQEGGWNADWFPLPGQAVFDRDTQHVAAVSRAPGNLDLFVIGFDNHIWTTFWTQEGGWNADWFPLPGQAVFDRDTQHVAAVSRAPGNLDLFVIGFDNRIWTTFWTQDGGWNGDLFPLPGQAVFDRDTQHVAAVSRAPGNLDLFVIGFDNRIWTTFYGTDRSCLLAGNYLLTMSATSIRLLNTTDGKESSRVDAPKSADENERQEFLDRLWTQIKAFVEQNTNDIIDGKIKAVDIGGFIYGTAAGIVIAIFNPIKGIPFLDKLLNAAFVGAAVQTGRFYGAIADDIVAIIKGEDKPRISAIVGVLATTTLTQSLPVGAALRVFGLDGWTLTKQLGVEVGGILEDGVHEIESIVNDVADVPGDVVDFVEDLF